MEQTTPRIRSLSPTKIETAMKCPEQLRLRYAEKIPQASFGSLTTGIIIHGVLEWALKKMIGGHALPDKKEADDYFVKLWKDTFAAEEAKEAFFSWEWQEGDNYDRAQRECRALVPFALKEILPSVKPKLIEENIKIEFDSPVGPFLVWGKLDLMEENCIVTDWKTALKKPSGNAKKMGMGLIYYTFKAIEYGADEVVHARKLFLVRGRKPSMELVKYTIGKPLRDYFVRVAIEVWKMCQADAFVPNPGGWWCKPDWCSFYSTCQGELE